MNALKTDGEFTVEVTAGMGVPSFAPRTVTLANGLAVAGVEVSTGNPHFVIVVDNTEFVIAGKSLASRSARRFASITISPTKQT